jgi:hypothetical protein
MHSHSAGAASFRSVVVADDYLDGFREAQWSFQRVQMIGSSGPVRSDLRPSFHVAIAKLERKSGARG